MTAEPLPAALPIGAEVELVVGQVAHGGHCVARHEGRVVFVRHALPGERVRVRITSEHGSYARADTVAILQPSSDRVDPQCPHAGPGRCGGCDFQHVEPAAQRRLKAEVVREQLARLAGITNIGVTVEELPGGPLGWRSRMRYAVDPSGVLGLHRHRSREVEPVSSCPLATAEVDAVGVGQARWPGVRALEVVVSSHGDTAVTLDTPKGTTVDPGAVPLGDDVALSVRHDRAAPRRVRGHRAVREVVDGRRLRVSVTGFWQAHPAAAEVLCAAVVDALRPSTGDSVLDLYAGAGLFARILADHVGATGRISVVESDRDACRDAGANLRTVAPTVAIERGRVDRVLTRLADRGERADVVVLDPPRAGAGAQVVHRIAALHPRAIAYVSCDPATLARDIATFAADGYRLTGLRAFDCFPMTAHVECVATLGPREH